MTEQILYHIAQLHKDNEDVGDSLFGRATMEHRIKVLSTKIEVDYKYYDYHN